MRIVVSGTHASGKSTLISDFVARHPEFTVLHDPFELIDEAWDSPSATMFAAQLRASADRLTNESWGQHVIAERGPIDFLAYLMAIAELTQDSLDEDLLDRARSMTASALRAVDLLVVLPLTSRDPIAVGFDEYLELRDAVDRILLDLIDDPDIVETPLKVVEISGEPSIRLATLEAALTS